MVLYHLLAHRPPFKAIGLASNSTWPGGHCFSKSVCQLYIVFTFSSVYSMLLIFTPLGSTNHNTLVCQPSTIYFPYHQYANVINVCLHQETLITTHQYHFSLSSSPLFFHYFLIHYLTFFLCPIV